MIIQFKITPTQYSHSPVQFMKAQIVINFIGAREISDVAGMVLISTLFPANRSERTLMS
jgi:hypothetical protein